MSGVLRPTDLLCAVSGLLVSVLLLMNSPADGGAAGYQTVQSISTLGTRGDAVLYSVSGIAVDRRRNLYVTDMLDYSVKKFDRGGACVARVGRRGAGPGEFKSPALSLVTGERLLVLQTQDHRIQVFDTDLRYRGEIVVQGGMPVDIAHGRSRTVAVALYTDSSRAVVLTYDGPEGRDPHRIPLEPTGEIHPLYSACRIALSRDGTLVAAYLFLNRVEIYGPDGRFLRRFSVDGMPRAETHEADGQVPEKTFVRKVLVDGSENILLLGGNQASHPGRDVFMYRPDGSHVRTFILPFRSRVIAGGENNTVYATDEAGTRVDTYILR